MPSKQEQYLDNCLKNNNIAGFFKAIDKWEIVPEYRLNEYNTLKAKFKHNPPYNFDQMLGVFALDLNYNTHFDNEIQLETTKNQQNMGNSATVNGNGNTVIQGGTVNTGTTPTPNQTPEPTPRKGWDWKTWLGALVLGILTLSSVPWWIPYFTTSSNPNPNPKTINGILVDNQAPPQPVTTVSKVYLELPDNSVPIRGKIDGKGYFEFNDVTVPDGTTSLTISIEEQGKTKSGIENINPNKLKNKVINLGKVQIK